MIMYKVWHAVLMPCSAGKLENVCYCDPACRKRRLNGPSRSRVCALALGDSALGCRRTVVQRLATIHQTAYELGQVTYMTLYILVEERRVYKTLINSYVRPWASRSSPIARGGRQQEITSTFALPMSTMTRQQ